jgi:hypothetical protein
VYLPGSCVSNTTMRMTTSSSVSATPATSPPTTSGTPSGAASSLTRSRRFIPRMGRLSVRRYLKLLAKQCHDANYANMTGVHGNQRQVASGCECEAVDAEQIIIAAELIKINEGVEEENTDVVILDKDGHAEFDMELHFEDNGSGAEVPSE